jgi:hypothetical protein
MNPTLPQAVVDEALARDPARAAAEWLGQFRQDVESLLTLDAVEALIEAGRVERPPVPGVKYVGFVDPSGGSSDSMTLAVAHAEGDAVVLDAVREVRPPFSPDAVVGEFVATLRAYRLHRVTGDRYAGEWPRERFRVRGVAYDIAESSKSELYGGLLPLINGGRVRLLDLPQLRDQLVGLERRTGRGTGRDILDHRPGGHDDVANAAAGALGRAVAARCRTAGCSRSIAAVPRCGASRRPGLASSGGAVGASASRHPHKEKGHVPLSNC